MDIPANEQSKSDDRRENEILGIRLFSAAPEGFNPIEATPRELLAYGYPARPDPVLRPRLHKLWTKMMSRPMQIIEPHFAVITKEARGQRKDYGPPAGNGWCGSIAFASSASVGQPNAPAPEAVAFVMGQWIVPHIVGPKPGNCVCACWVGIDGGGGAENPSNDILQAGTTQAITVNWHGGGDYSSFAWCEWYPADPVAITNLAVSPGDTMFCTICASSPTSAVIHLLNVTTGTGTVFIKTAPTNVSGQPVNVQLAGDTAEWIVEAWVDEDYDLGRFGDIFFDECIAETRNGYTILGGRGNLEPMQDVNGNTIAVASTKADELILIRYTDPSP